ncbi:MAG: hypothetical protein LBN03_02305, partial [Bifidobacteriaceae bacterium]|nr:hypothetical protein [Bifidobacteriaceae bacterium]
MRNLSIKNKSIIILISIFAVLIAASYAYINALSQNKNNAFADNITYPIHASVKATNFGIVIGADLGNLGGGTFTQTPYNQLPYTALTPSNLYMVFQYTLTTTISKDSVEGTCQDTTENHLSSEANINALKSDLKKFKPSKIVANDTIVETATATWELQSENCVIVSTLRFKPSNHTGYNQDSIDTTTQEFDLYGSQGTEHKV